MENQIIEILKKRIKEKDKCIIGIGGFGGLGKTTQFKKLQKELSASIMKITF